MTGWCVYIVQCADGTLYTGITNDLEQRLARHNDGSGAKYTRTRRPVRLVYTEPSTNRSAASKQEAAIRKLDRTAKLEMIRSQAGRSGTQN